MKYVFQRYTGFFILTSKQKSIIKYYVTKNLTE